MIYSLVDPRGLRTNTYITLPDTGCNANKIVVVPAPMCDVLYPPPKVSAIPEVPVILSPPPEPVLPKARAYNEDGDIRCPTCGRTNFYALEDETSTTKVKCKLCYAMFLGIPW